jgi:hypothetical protein
MAGVIVVVVILAIAARVRTRQRRHPFPLLRRTKKGMARMGRRNVHRPRQTLSVFFAETHHPFKRSVRDSSLCVTRKVRG